MYFIYEISEQTNHRDRNESWWLSVVGKETYKKMVGVTANGSVAFGGVMNIMVMIGLFFGYTRNP